MPFAEHTNQTAGDFEQPFSPAGFMQINNPEMPVPIVATIAASGNWNSGLIYSDGYRNLSVGVTMSQAGSLVISRFIDTAGLVAQAASTTSIVANTPVIVNLTDDLPFATYSIQINNTGGSTGNITNFAILMVAG